MYGKWRAGLAVYMVTSHVRIFMMKLKDRPFISEDNSILTAYIDETQKDLSLNNGFHTPPL